MQFHVIKFDENSINFRRVGILSNLMEWIIQFTWNWKKKKKKTRENSPLLLPHPDILRNFFRNCIRVGLSGGELVACLLVVLLLLPPGIPDCDSKEYWRDSNDACRGDAWVLKKKLKTGIITAIWRLFHHFNFNYDCDSNEYWRILNEACCRWSSEKKIEFKNSLKWCIVII